MTAFWYRITDHPIAFLAIVALMGVVCGAVYKVVSLSLVGSKSGILLSKLSGISSRHWTRVPIYIMLFLLFLLFVSDFFDVNLADVTIPYISAFILVLMPMGIGFPIGYWTIEALFERLASKS